MKLLMFEIPDDLTLLPEWLEGHLMGLHLPRVVTELSVLSGSSEEPRVSLSGVLGDQRQDVLQTGLRSLARPQLRQLMQDPPLLLELQRLVLDEGGEYWMTVPHSDAVAENTKKTWANLQEAIAEETPKSGLARPTPSGRKAWLWAGAGWLAATAATVALFFVRADRVHELEGRLAQQSTEVNSLRNDLQAQRLGVEPADLPDAQERLVHATADPIDLPGDDPSDLPEIH